VIVIKRVLAAIEDSFFTAIDPIYLDIAEEDILNYIEKHPMPEDPVYSKDDLIYDLVYSSGMYTLPEDTSEEMIEYIEKLLNYLVS